MSFNILHRLRIARKMLLAIGTVCMLFAVLGSVALLSLYQLYENATAADAANLTAVQNFEQVRLLLGDSRRSEFNAVLCPDADCIAKHVAARKTRIEGVAHAIDALRQSATDADAASLQQFQSDFNAYLPQSNRVIELVQSGQRDAAIMQMRTASGPLFDGLVHASEAQLTARRAEGARATSEAASRFHQRLLVTVGLMLVIVAASLGIGRMVTRAICRPIDEAVAMLGRVAEKDLSQMLSVTSQDELAVMAASLNTTIRSISSVLGTVTDSSYHLASATELMSANAVQSSLHAMTLSSQVQQVAASTAEMAATITEISSNAEQAAEASRTSARGAEQGGAVMDQTSETMERIATANDLVCKRIETLSQHSQSISQIVTVIHEIAEQTNLLALNAAIESARAGEHGRGFAVVSSEVRRLAERSRQSSEEIARRIAAVQTEMSAVTEMVEAGRGDMEDGRHRISEARMAIETIIEMARQAEHMVTMIATSAAQQSMASNEISASIGEIAMIASESAEASDRTASACTELGSLAGSLDHLVKQFQLA